MPAKAALTAAARASRLNTASARSRAASYLPAVHQPVLAAALSDRREAETCEPTTPQGTPLSSGAPRIEKQRTQRMQLAHSVYWTGETAERGMFAQSRGSHSLVAEAFQGDHARLFRTPLPANSIAPCDLSFKQPPARMHSQEMWLA